MFGKLSFENQVNAVGALVFVLIGGYAVTEAVKSRDLPACQASYPTPTQMSFLRSNGTPMAPAELQARIGVGERGILEKASVAKSDGPGAYALSVKVGALQENGPAVSFQWSPSNIGNATAACLSYSVNLPHDFEFSQGGYLPGIVGDMINVPKGVTSAQTGFGSRPQWGENGVLSVEANTSEQALAEGAMRIAPKEVTLPRGRWVRIDQEVVLNSPNAQNGQLRLWVDGKLAVTNSKLAWRGHSGIRISGIGADIGYARMKTNILPNRHASVIRISPLQLAWKSVEITASSK